MLFDLVEDRSDSLWDFHVYVSLHNGCVSLDFRLLDVGLLLGVGIAVLHERKLVDYDGGVKNHAVVSDARGYAGSGVVFVIFLVFARVAGRGRVAEGFLGGVVALDADREVRLVVRHAAARDLAPGVQARQEFCISALGLRVNRDLGGEGKGGGGLVGGDH